MTFQAMIDGSVSGGTLNVPHGVYEAVTIAKPLTITGEGAVSGPIKVRSDDVTIQGMVVRGSTGINNSLIETTGARTKVLDNVLIDSECYGLRSYHVDGLVAERNVVDDVATAFFSDHGTNETYTDNEISNCRRMVKADNPGANGGTAYQFGYATNCRVSGGSVSHARALPSPFGPSYADGSLIEIFGSCADILIQDVEARDVLCVMETGKQATDTDPVRVTLRNIRATGNGSPKASQLAIGLLIRTGVDFTIDSCQFRDMDWYVLDIESGGGFGGVVSGLTFTNNKVWLGSGLAYQIAVGNEAIKLIAGNRIHGTGTVAEVRGQQTSDLTQFRTWTGQPAKKEAWGLPA